MLEWFWLIVCHLSCNSICLHYRRHFLGWADILSCKHDIIDYRDVILLVMQGLYLVYLVSSQGHFRRRQWHPTPLLLPGKSHGWRSLVDCSPWGHEESDMTEWLHFHFSLSCIGEGNGNPLQCSCLENSRDGGALWAAVYGVTQSRTRLKWLSSSNSKVILKLLT